MPQCCAVPRCSNESSGHRFPKDQTRRKAWLIVIKRDKFVPSEHARVCKKHFREEDYQLPKDSVRATPKPVLKNEAVPSVFAWSKTPTAVSLGRRERAQRRSRKRGETIFEQPENLINEQLPDPPGEVPSNREVGGDVYMADDSNVECEICVDPSKVICDSNNSDDGNSEMRSDSINNCVESNELTEVVPDSQRDVEENVMEGEDHVQIEREPCSHVMRVADYKSVAICS